METDDKNDDDNLMVLMMLMITTVCWNMIRHCQGRTRLIVFVKDVLRKAFETETGTVIRERKNN